MYDERRDRRVADHVLGNAANQCALDGADAARPHHDQVGLLIVRDATDALAGVLVRLAAQLEMYLRTYNRPNAVTQQLTTCRYLHVHVVCL